MGLPRRAAGVEPDREGGHPVTQPLSPAALAARDQVDADIREANRKAERAGLILGFLFLLFICLVIYKTLT
jgi:hypothetical protein